MNNVEEEKGNSRDNGGTVEEASDVVDNGIGVKKAVIVEAF